MTITNRMHRYLVDNENATEEMRNRAELEKDVIITNYAEERWDAPVLIGIMKIFCLMARVEDDAGKLYSREHSCFCDKCVKGKFEECTQTVTTGSLRSEVLLKLPYKEPTSKKTPAEGDLLERIKYFKDLIADGSDHQKIVAVPSENRQENEEPFKLAIITKTVKQLKKDFVHECSINGSLNRITVMKGEWCITLRFMQCIDEINKEYTIPLRAKEMKVSILNVCHPHDSNVPFDLISTSQTVEVTNGQSVIYYKISEGSLDIIRSSLDVEL